MSVIVLITKKYFQIVDTKKDINASSELLSNYSLEVSCKEDQIMCGYRTLDLIYFHSNNQ